MATVLVVDDDPAVLRLAASILEQAGFLVMRARNGLEALHVYASYADRIDLLVTDLDMPEMDGVQLVTRLRAIHGAVRVVAVTGRAPDEIPVAFASCLLLKPFRRQDLVQAVEAALGAA